MMAEKRRQDLSLQEKEDLAEAVAVREHPCLYDKTKKEYQDKIVTKNVWKQVADQLIFIENGKLKKLRHLRLGDLVIENVILFLCYRVKSSFKNLKKNYTKKRSNLKNSKRSGTSREAVEKAESELLQWSFLT